MATKEEIREWLEACGAREGQYMAYTDYDGRKRNIWCTSPIEITAEAFCVDKTRCPHHLLNPLLTGIQGPTFAEWQRQKGREGKVEKITKMLEEAYGGTMLWPKNIARKILDAIEGE